MKIDWLSFTVYSDNGHKENLWRDVFANSLGVLTDTGHGLQGFKRLERALEGASVMSFPSKGEGGYYHISLPGKALANVSPDVLKRLFSYLLDVAWNITRLDIAFDAGEHELASSIHFTPHDFYEKAKAEMMSNKRKMKTFANKKTLKWHEAPFEEKENGKEGTSGCYLGARSSERMVRVYDIHGFTRVEFQIRGMRADLVGKALFVMEYHKWEEFGKSQLKQYVDFEDWDDWIFFMSAVVRSDLKIGSAHRASLNKSIEYIRKQVSPTLSVLADVWGGADFNEFIEEVMRDARKKPRDRYQSILENAEKAESAFLDE